MFGTEREVLQELSKRHLDLDEVQKIAAATGSQSPEREAKEVAWKLVEEGKAVFTDEWFLALPDGDRLKQIKATTAQPLQAD